MQGKIFNLDKSLNMFQFDCLNTQEALVLGNKYVPFPWSGTVECINKEIDFC